MGGRGSGEEGGGTAGKAMYGDTAPLLRSTPEKPTTTPNIKEQISQATSNREIRESIRRGPAKLPETDSEGQWVVRYRKSNWSSDLVYRYATKEDAETIERYLQSKGYNAVTQKRTFQLPSESTKPIYTVYYRRGSGEWAHRDYPTEESAMKVERNLREQGYDAITQQTSERQRATTAKMNVKFEAERTRREKQRIKEEEKERATKKTKTIGGDIVIGEPSVVRVRYDRHTRGWYTEVEDKSQSILDIEYKTGMRSTYAEHHGNKEAALNTAKELSKHHKISIEIMKAGRVGKTIAAPRPNRILETIRAIEGDYQKTRELGQRIMRELPPESAWKHPSGRGIAEAAIGSFMGRSGSSTLIIARDDDTNKFRGATSYSRHGRDYIYIEYLSGTGGGTGTELIQRVIRENPGKGIQLVPLSTARSYYHGIGMHNVEGHLGFTPEEAALFEKYGKEWKKHKKE